MFGLTPSPAILSSLIQHHLEKYEQKEPHEITAFYVDDVIGGSTNDDKGIEIYENVNEIMKDGGFGLRKWTSNSKVFQERVVVEEQSTKVTKPLTVPGIDEYRESSRERERYRRE